MNERDRGKMRERLELVPWTRFCIDCQEQAETDGPETSVPETDVRETGRPGPGGPGTGV